MFTGITPRISFYQFNGIISCCFSVEIAKKLTPYLGKLDSDNKQRLQKVIDLLNSNLEGLRVERSDFDGALDVRALTAYKGRQDDLEMIVTLNTTWNAKDGLDIAYFVHELFHVVDVRVA